MEVGKKKTKTVRVSQRRIDIVMAMPPRRPFPRPTAEEVRAALDPVDPESAELGAELLELFDSCEARLKFWEEEEDSIRRQYLAKGYAEVEVTDDDDEAN
ncbi:hypothetical protein ACP70R_025003 [Stipagrostis hirtigluma subsp. patula]